jgi:hypothetical protein
MRCPLCAPAPLEPVPAALVVNAVLFDAYVGEQIK